MSTVTAADFAGEKVDSAVSAFAATAPSQFLLNHLELLWGDDGFVVAFHIILRNFTLVLLFLLCKEVYGVGLLKERITLVLLIFDDATNSAVRPLYLSFLIYSA